MTLLLALGLSGCGYHAAGAATHVPANVRTLGVPIFATNVLAYHTEVSMTAALVRELNARTRYRVLNTGQGADAVLNGTVLAESIAPLTYDSSTGESSSFLITITAKVVLTASGGRVLYRNPNYTFRQQYQATEDLSSFIQEDSPAVHRLSRDFAQALVSDMLESF